MRNLRNFSGAFVVLAGTAVLVGCSAEGAATDAQSPATSAPTESTASAVPEAPAVPEATAAPTSRYADGSYEATGTYGGGPSFIGVELTLGDGLVTAVEIETPATNETSLRYQELFASGIGAVVVGRPLAELDVDNVAGSSSTVDGYNDAVAQIMAQAAR